MKTCGKCKQAKPEEAFNWKDKAKGKRHSYCSACAREHRNDHYVKNRSETLRRSKVRNAKVCKEHREKIRQYLMANQCVDCGEKDPIVLDFDHVRGEKLGNVSMMVRDAHSWERIRAEIEKCEIRCANCHRRVTAYRAGWHRLNW